MRSKTWKRRAALAAVLCGVAASVMAARIQAGPRAQRESAAEAAVVALSLPAQPPQGALVLFSGKAGELSDQWVQRYTKKTPDWTIGKDGATVPKGGDIATKQEFGDCYLHVEFRAPVDANGKTIGHGNAGVGLQGRYEIQIVDSYGQKPESHGAGSLYSQKPPKVNVSKKPGEWQSFDIIFRAPRIEDGGQITEKPRATVFHNGVLIHNNAEFTGMTGIQYDEYKAEAKAGPLVLQGDHDPVQFRNVWIIPQ